MRRPFASPITVLGRSGVLFLILLALIAAGGAWWYFAPGSMPSWLARAVPASPSLGPPLYKWRDDKGRLHITDQPPADRPYEAVRYDPNTNVVPDSKSP